MYGVGLLIGYVALQILYLHSIGTMMGDKVTQAEAGLSIYGGMNKLFNPMEYGKWIVLNGFMLLLVLYQHSAMGSLDMMLLARSTSRGMWWTAKLMSAVLISLIYSILIVLCTNGLAGLFLLSSDQWSLVTEAYFPGIYDSELSVSSLRIASIIIFITGNLAMVTLFLTLNIACAFQPRRIFGVVIGFVICTGVYVGGGWPKLLTPMLYGSTLDLPASIQNYGGVIVSNLVVILVSIISGYVLVRKYSISSYSIENQ